MPIGWRLCAVMLVASTGAACSTGATVAQSGSSLSPHPAAASPTVEPASTATPAPTSPQRAEPPLPAPREETAEVALKGNIYVIGGFDAAGHDLADVLVGDGVSWRAGPPLPLALDHPAAAVAGDSILVAGGFHEGVASARTFWLRGDGWHEGPPLAYPRGALALISTSDSIAFAFGGRSAATEVATVEKLDVASNRWMSVGTLPDARDHLAGFAFSGRACAAGGRVPSTSARVDCYDPNTSTWARLPDLPVATSGAGAGVLGTDVIVAGGEDASEHALVTSVYRLRGSAWIPETMLTPRHGFQFAAVAGRLWACGGGIAPGLHATAVCTSIG